MWTIVEYMASPMTEATVEDVFAECLPVVAFKKYNHNLSKLLLWWITSLYIFFPRYLDFNWLSYFLTYSTFSGYRLKYNLVFEIKIPSRWRSQYPHKHLRWRASNSSWWLKHFNCCYRALYLRYFRRAMPLNLTA